MTKTKFPVINCSRAFLWEILIKVGSCQTFFLSSVLKHLCHFSYSGKSNGFSCKNNHPHMNAYFPATSMNQKSTLYLSSMSDGAGAYKGVIFLPAITWQQRLATHAQALHLRKRSYMLLYT